MSGLTAEDREDLWSGLRRARHEDAPVPLARDYHKTHVLWAVAPVVEEIVARHIEAFREQAAMAIEADAAASLGASDHVTLGVIAAISEGKTRAARIVRDLPR